MTFYDALILQKTSIFCREFLLQNDSIFSSPPKSICTWTALSEWNMTQPRSSGKSLCLARQWRLARDMSWLAVLFEAPRGALHASGTLTRSCATKNPVESQMCTSNDPFTFQTQGAACCKHSMPSPGRAKASG